MQTSPLVFICSHKYIVIGGQWSLIELDVCFVSISGQGKGPGCVSISRTCMGAGNGAKVSWMCDRQWNMWGRRIRQSYPECIQWNTWGQLGQEDFGHSGSSSTLGVLGLSLYPAAKSPSGYKTASLEIEHATRVHKNGQLE